MEQESCENLCAHVARPNHWVTLEYPIHPMQRLAWQYSPADARDKYSRKSKTLNEPNKDRQEHAIAGRIIIHNIRQHHTKPLISKCIGIESVYTDQRIPHGK